MLHLLSYPHKCIISSLDIIDKNWKIQIVVQLCSRVFEKKLNGNAYFFKNLLRSHYNYSLRKKNNLFATIWIRTCYNLYKFDRLIDIDTKKERSSQSHAHRIHNTEGYKGQVFSIFTIKILFTFDTLCISIVNTTNSQFLFFAR